MVGVGTTIKFAKLLLLVDSFICSWSIDWIDHHLFVTFYHFPSGTPIYDTRCNLYIVLLFYFVNEKASLCLVYLYFHDGISVGLSPQVNATHIWYEKIEGRWPLLVNPY